MSYKFKIGQLVRVKKIINFASEPREDMEKWVGRIFPIAKIDEYWQGPCRYLLTCESDQYFSVKELEALSKEDLLKINRKGVIEKINQLWKRQPYYQTFHSSEQYE